MDCLLPSINVKLFAKAIHCLAKIGSEIYFEPLETGLALKTVNSSRSAYICFMFLRPLFQTYICHHATGDNSTLTGPNEENFFKCKIAVKTLLQVFKSTSTIERTVESCSINLDDKDCRLIFQLKCKHGIKKTHRLTFQECESLQAVFAKDLSPNVLTCKHKLLGDITGNFASGLEELTMAVTPCQVAVRSFVSDDEESSKIMKTEMTLDPEEFDDFQIGVDTEITFCLKDLRAVLVFCEVAETELQMHFEVGGKPLVISAEQEDYFRANFVLATVANDEESQLQKPNRSSHSSTPALRSKSTASKKPSSGVKKAPKRLTTSKTFAPNTSLRPAVRPVTTNGHSTREPEATISPEIPYVDAAMNGEPAYKHVKTVFFESTQNLQDHSIMVLAPDSDEEDGFG